MRSKFVLPLILALVGTSAARAQLTKEPAALLPEKTLVYAELRQIGLLATEIGELFKGSALEDVPQSLNKFQSKYKLEGPGLLRPSSMGAGVFGLLVAPEVRAEVGRLQGAAVGFTGVNPKTGDAEYLAVVLPGQSNAPAFIMRSMLSMAPMQKLETVEGVTLYGLETVKFKSTAKPGEKPVEERIVSIGTVFAMTPGTLLIGTQDNVKQAVQRLKGKVALEDRSLAQNAVFNQARSAVENRPGVFVYGNPAQLLPLLDSLPLPAGEKAILTTALKTVNTTALVQSYSLERGKFFMRKAILLDPKEKSPILDVLPTRPVDFDVLNYAPKDAVFVAAIDNGDGEKRFENLVALIDPLSPKDAKFSDMIAQTEKALGFSIGKDVVGQISSIGFALGDPFQVKIKVTERIGDGFHSVSNVAEVPPMAIIVKAVNDKAAEKLLELVPKVWRYGAGAPVEPIKKQIDGREVYILKLGKDEGDEAVCYGRQGSTLVICPQAATVASCLNAGVKKQGFLSHPQVFRRTIDVGGRQAVVFVKPITMIAGFGIGMAGSISSKVTEKATGKPAVKEIDDKKPDDKKADDKKADDKKADDKKADDKKPEVKVTYKSALDDPIAKQLSEILKDEEFLAGGLQVTKQKLQFEISGAVQKVVPQLIDMAIDSMYREEAARIRRIEEMRKKDREKPEPK